MIDVHRILESAFAAGCMLTIIGMIVFAAQLKDDGEDLP
jgi:hypothetical protein